jgi:predicted  nucleic acid-binding Zn-ribbon protein
VATLKSYLALEDRMTPAITNATNALDKATVQMEKAEQKVAEVESALSAAQDAYNATTSTIDDLIAIQREYEDALQTGASTAQLSMDVFDRYGISLTDVGSKIDELDQKSISLDEAMSKQENRLREVTTGYEFAQAKVEQYSNKLQQQQGILDKATQETIKGIKNIKDMSKAQLEDAAAALKRAIATDDTTKKLNQHEKQLEKVQKQLAKVGTESKDATEKAGQGFESLSGKITAAAAAMQLFNMARQVFGRITGAIGGLIQSAKDFQEVQTQLTTVMRNTMGAGNDTVRSVLDYSKALASQGVVSKQAVIAGSQELSTYLTKADTLKTIMPIMTDMAAQQYGYNASVQSTTQIATMLGKVMDGQVGALSRYGYKFDEAQEKILKMGNEMERAAVLAEVVGASVGGMNAALGKTPVGALSGLNTALGETKEAVGALLLGIQSAFAMGFMEAVGEAESLVTQLKDFIMENKEVIVKGLIIAGAIVAAIAAAMAISWMIAHWPLVLIGVAVIWLIQTLAGGAASIEDIMGFIVGFCFAAGTAITGVFDAVGEIIGGIVDEVVDVMSGLTSELDTGAIEIEDIMGFIVGVIDAAVAIIWDIIMFIGDVILIVCGIGENIFKNFGTFMSNVFKNPVAAIADLFYRLIDTILSLIESAAIAISNLLGADYSSGISNLRGKLQAFIGEQAAAAGLEAYDETPIKTMADLGFQYKNAATEFNKGWEKGAQIGKDMKESFARGNEVGRKIGAGIQSGLDQFMGFDALGAGGDIADYEVPGGGGGGKGGKSLSTKEAGEIKISKEQIKMLYDAARREFIINYQQLEPQVKVEIDTVAQTTDIEEVVDRIAEGIKDVTDTKLEVPVPA